MLSLCKPCKLDKLDETVCGICGVCCHGLQERAQGPRVVNVISQISVQHHSNRRDFACCTEDCGEQHGSGCKCWHGLQLGL